MPHYDRSELKRRTKGQLIDLITELQARHPEPQPLELWEMNDGSQAVVMEERDGVFDVVSVQELDLAGELILWELLDYACDSGCTVTASLSEFSRRIGKLNLSLETDDD